MPALNKEDIVKAKDSELTEVEVPEWGGSVYIGNMDLGDLIDFYDNIDTTAAKKTNTVENVLDILLKILKDENGVRLFQNKEREALGNKSSEVLLRIFNTCVKVLPMLNRSKEDTKKNLNETQQNFSPSD